MLIAQRPVISSEQITQTRSKFTMEPLEPGFGYTLGNSLRRTLLSSIPGAAVTSIKIDGIKHEFETHPGVKEDIAEIILNIKNLVISSEIDEPVAIYLSVNKPGPVTAGDINTVAGVEVHNKNLHLATLSKGSLEIEFVVERGRGYVSAEDNKKLSGNLEVDRIVIDSIYTPVLKVSFNVEATRVGQHTNFDKLVLDVETKENITPIDAVASAGKTLVELFGLIHSLNESAEGVEIGEEITSFEFAPIDENDAISLLDLPQRAYNALHHNHIDSISLLTSLTKSELLSMAQMGKTSVDNIIEALESQGKSLKGAK